jgi:hypothetical protein
MRLIIWGAILLVLVGSCNHRPSWDDSEQAFQEMVVGQEAVDFSKILDYIDEIVSSAEDYLDKQPFNQNALEDTAAQEALAALLDKFAQKLLDLQEQYRHVNEQMIFKARELHAALIEFRYFVRIVNFNKIHNPAQGGVEDSSCHQLYVTTYNTLSTIPNSTFSEKNFPGQADQVLGFIQRFRTDNPCLDLKQLKNAIDRLKKLKEVHLQATAACRNRFRELRTTHLISQGIYAGGHPNYAVGTTMTPVGTPNPTMDQLALFGKLIWDIDQVIKACRDPA